METHFILTNRRPIASPGHAATTKNKKVQKDLKLHVDKAIAERIDKGELVTAERFELQMRRTAKRAAHPHIQSRKERRREIRILLQEHDKEIAEIKQRRAIQQKEIESNV